MELGEDHFRYSMRSCLSANYNVASGKTCLSKVPPVGRNESTLVCSTRQKSKAQRRCEFKSEGTDCSGIKMARSSMHEGYS